MNKGWGDNIITETYNAKICQNCNKLNVCKYSDRVLKQTKELTDGVSKLDLPLIINVKCKEWMGKSNILR